MKILVTGAAGFIGMHVSMRLLECGHSVVGVDSLNSYYNVKLKQFRLDQLETMDNFLFQRLDVSDRRGMEEIFGGTDFDLVIHLAAQAGVRHSIAKPFEYTDSNLTGFMTILEGCRHKKVNLIYASSSSVYGTNKKVPFSEADRVDNPASLYAATKRANELMAESYSQLYSLNACGLRFFTVYGPAGRPDMAPWLFAEAILEGKPIKVFNNGAMSRDFTYIDDIVDGVIGLASKIGSFAGDHQVFNIGCGAPVNLMDFVSEVERAVGAEAVKHYEGMQPGDVPATFCDTTRLAESIGYAAKVPVEDGVPKFVAWLREYRNQYPRH